MLSIHNLDNIYRKAVETEMSANAYSNSIIIHWILQTLGPVNFGV